MSLPGPGWVDAALCPGVDAGGDTDSTAGLQQVLDMAGAHAGQQVFLRPGTYLISAPLVIPPAVRIEGAMGMIGADPGTTFTQCMLKASPSFTGDALLEIRDAHLAGYEKQSGNQQIRHLMLHGGNSPPGIGGLRITGPVQGVQVEDVCIYRVTGNGITGTGDPYYSGGQRAPYNMRALRVRVHYASGSGLDLSSVTDSTWIDVHAIGCETGWNIKAGANSRYIGCRAEGSNSHGYNVSRTGSGTGSGGITFVGCSTDGNAYSGFMYSGSGHAPVVMSGCMSRGDATGGGSGNAALRVNGATYPVIVGDFSVYPTDRRVPTPQNGVIVQKSPYYVGLSNVFIHAGRTPLEWDDSGSLSIRNLATRTGSTVSPSAIILEKDIAASSPGGIPKPDV